MLENVHAMLMYFLSQF